MASRVFITGLPLWVVAFALYAVLGAKSRAKLEATSARPIFMPHYRRDARKDEVRERFERYGRTKGIGASAAARLIAGRR